MNKLYSVHDHWTDINKKNDVDIESIDGVITGIKVNGEDYGGKSDLIWILPEQTVTLVEQPVEITGLRLDLIPQGVDLTPLKNTTENFGHLHTYYVTLHYDGSGLSEDNGTFSIYPQDGSYYFVNADDGTIIKGEYTISIALF